MIVTTMWADMFLSDTRCFKSQHVCRSDSDPHYAGLNPEQLDILLKKTTVLKDNHFTLNIEYIQYVLAE